MGEKSDYPEEYKHVCKLCNKRYPSGKSLGGHMRSHVIANAYASGQKMKSKKAPIFSSKYNDDDLGGSGYGLRENPKKTWRAEDSPLIVQQERVCKQCGKVFQSLKALCGHMSCHSDKERKFSKLNGYDDDEDEEEDDDEDDEEDEDELWESDEEEEEEGDESKNRSSSAVSEIENEQEEVAICLMMLSRDSGNHKVAFNFTTESSDNNSVILETGSGSRILKKKIMDDSDSGYFENGAKELESDDSVDWYAKFKHESGFVDAYKEHENRDKAQLKRHLRSRDGYEVKKMKQECQVNTKVSKYVCWICQRSFKTHQALGGHIITHRRNNNNNNGSSFVIKNSIAKDVNGSKKTKGHTCPFCPKVFRSGQALGGHKRSHLIGCSPEDKANLIRSVERKSSEDTRRFLDLNLPAPVEEDGGGGGAQFMPW